MLPTKSLLAILALAVAQCAAATPNAGAGQVDAREEHLRRAAMIQRNIINGLYQRGDVDPSDFGCQSDDECDEGGTCRTAGLNHVKSCLY